MTGTEGKGLFTGQMKEGGRWAPGGLVENDNDSC